MPAPEPTAPAALPAEGIGWYLYGVTRNWSGAAAPAWLAGAGDGGVASAPGPAGREPVQLLERDRLAAVIRPVSLEDYRPETLETRLGDAAWLEAMVRSHNDVIAAVHQERAILPAKFGCVYARVEDLATALEQAHCALLAQLERLVDCDEWAVHVYVDPSSIRETLGEEPGVHRLRQELAASRPGRAYFLRRKLADELAARTEQRMAEVAQATFDRLAGFAVDAHLDTPVRASRDATGEIEALRAAFLVHRARREGFVAEARHGAEGRDGWRCSYSGPWPPYTFAVFDERTRDVEHRD